MSISEYFESITIPIKYVKLATGNFADENLLKESSSKETQLERPTIEVVIKELEKALNFQINNKERLSISLKDIKLGIKKQIVTQSLTEFVDIAIECLKDKRSDHLLIERASYVVEHVTKALVFQKSADDNDLHISLEAIKLGTRNFSDLNCIGEGRIWKLYKGEIADAKGRTTIVAKRWDTKSQQEHIQEFQTELHTLLNYKHKNIIRLVGYYDMMDENIIVYEHVHNGRLDKHLADPGLTWMKRLKICLDVAKGMEYFHRGAFESLKHRDIKSGSILLDSDWNAKISNFELSCKTLKTDEDSDMYAFGVFLIEMLCGRSAWGEECKDQSQSLGPLAVRHYNENGSFDEMIFGGIKHQISPRSLTKYESIALGCLGVITCLRDFDKYDSKYAYARRLVIDLEEALKFQEDHETWGPSLPMDYKEIIQASIPPIDDSEHMKQDIYAFLSKGVLLQGGKTLFSLGSNGERSELISAKMFSYKNRNSRKWLSVEESRFQKAVQMLDISKLKIKIKIRTQLLSPTVNYGAYLIFKFSDSKKISSNPMYVNLKYKMGGANLHAYFATWRDDKWMEIELHRFFSHRKDRDFEVLLESFSRYHCGNGFIYVEGIEFRVIDNVSLKVQNKHSTQQVQQLLKSDSNMKFEHFLTQREVNGKKHLMLSATDVLYEYSSNVKHFQLHPSAESRFQEVVELLPQHLFRINCKINRHQMLSQNTEYLCYLVFKLSEKCVGLHCPVRVTDLRNRNKKKAEIVYFRSPRPWNLHGNNIVPKQREDGWMEVKVWKFNSHDQLKNGSIPVNLKLITYEGTMSGLIICGMEFRPYCMWRGHCIESTIYKQM
ncbi:hypothetical protein SSX86_013093 [Deinandra increscens subsp. villosa]|uniref:Protein kinase domain-containing protein n=1 Tax=Deinandra increscens subsp. villosa TaxID=3103831 RepID=A0AAP0D9Y5_9ASTR